MLVGGTIFGVLGFLFAPQISAALLTDEQRLKLPRFLEEEAKDPEQTKQARWDQGRCFLLAGLAWWSTLVSCFSWLGPVSSSVCPCSVWKLFTSVLGRLRCEL